MDFALQVHLHPLFSIANGLNGPANFADLCDDDVTLCCLTTASRLSPIRSTSLRCALSRSTSSRQRAESSICPFYPKRAACLIISSISLSICMMRSRICLGLSVELLVLFSRVDMFFLVFCSTSCSLRSIQALWLCAYLCIP